MIKVKINDDFFNKGEKYNFLDEPFFEIPQEKLISKKLFNFIAFLSIMNTLLIIKLLGKTKNK